MATITGSAGADTIDGNGSSAGVNGTLTDFSDVVFAGTGSDIVTARGSNISPNYYFGNDGNDTLTSGGSGGGLYGEVGDDSLVSAANYGLVLDGGLGNDVLWSSAASEYLTGGSGNDTILGNAGFDTIFGGAGADSLAGGADGDFIDGGSDNNTISGDGGNDTIFASFGHDSISGGDGFDTIDAGSGDNTVSGGNDADQITASFGHDSISGGDGFDTIMAGNGNNTVDGGSGFDSIFAGNGNDLIVGGANGDTLDGGDFIAAGDGSNTVSGGFGNDTVLAGFGNDSLAGEDGNDSLVGGEGANTLMGGIGNDTLTGGFGNDFLLGGDGNDLIDAGGGGGSIPGAANVVDGGAGNDTILAMFGADNLSGGDGNDYIDAGGGNNSVTGGTGDDVIFAGSGADSLSGGDGNDTLTGASGADTLLGGLGNDLLDGGESGDFLDGGAGNDTLLASGGGDTVMGSAGNDRIDGGDGTDVLDYSGLGAGSRVVISIANGFFRVVKTAGGTQVGIDTVQGFETYIGTAGNDKFTGWGQDETFTGGAGNDTIDGGDGFDTVRYDVAGVGDVVANLATGVVQDGLGGIDLLRRGTSNNYIEAIISGDGNDLLIGDSDNNTLRGKGGADTLDGGTGYDLADYSGDSSVTGVLANLGNVVVGGVAGGQARDSFGSIDRLISIEAVRGTDAADTLVGSDGDDQLRGQRGADVIDGGHGHDVVDYRNDSDGIFGQPGFGDGFGVVVNLSEAPVTIAGFGAEPTFVIGAGVGRDGWGDFDVLTDIESVRGSNLHDLLIGGTRVAAVTVDGVTNYATERSSLIGRVGNDTLQAGATSDGVIASYVDDISGVTVRLDLGTAEDGWGTIDTLVNIRAAQGSAYDDVITAHAGGSWMRGRGGDDLLTAGAGFDVVSFGTATEGVVVTLLTGLAQDGEGGIDTLVGSFEFIVGGAFNDTLVGDADGTWFFGDAGADSMVGGAGQDVLSFYSAWVGVDPVHDGIAVNLLNQTARDGGGTIDRFSSIEHVVGTAGADSLLGNTLGNTLAGAEGGDTLDGGAGDDTLLGGLGNDLFIINARTDLVVEEAGGGADTVQSSTSYTLAAEVEALVLTGAGGFYGYGNALDNLVVGNTGNNALQGGASGNDTLRGGAGADTLTGFSGADELQGGAGADIFVFDRAVDSRGSTFDRIVDFEVGIDHIAFENNAGRLFAGLTPTAINLNAVQTIASANSVAQVYAGIGAIAASTATLQMKQVDVTAGTMAGSYLFVNDGTAAAAANADMLIRLDLVGGVLTAGDLMLF